MDNQLKARMMTAAVGADQIYQREWAKAITEGVAEIERLHQVMFDLGAKALETARVMQSVLPYLRRIEQPSEEMFVAMCQGETPFIERRKMDKSGYEVVRADNADWREVISSEQTVVFEGTFEDAREFRARCEFYWRFNQMLQIAAKAPIPNPEQPV